MLRLIAQRAVKSGVFRGRASFSLTPQKKKHVPAVITFLNKTYKDYPIESVLMIPVSDSLFIFGTYCFVAYSHLPIFNDIPIDFALAFAISRPLRRFRIPADMATSYALVKMFPVLKEVKISQLYVFSMATDPKNPPKTFGFKMLHKLEKMGLNLADRFGVAYMIGSRLCGAAVVMSLYITIRNGFDLKTWLQETFGEEKLQSAMDSFAGMATSMAVAVTLGAFLNPFSIIAAGGMASKLGKLGFVKNLKSRRFNNPKSR